MSSFVELNNFVQAENGVYHELNQDRDFKYSDGEQTEVKLHQILSGATDLSSGSSELQAQIVDWPTEYHLSAARSNLLRALNLTGVKRVLELGCGCGSISRFLGEQAGLTIDSIEGSATRAALAAMRCRDLPNVTICTANFNQVDFPEDYYDLVLFVGVTEYAGRFSERATDQDALQDLLSLSRRVTKPNGVTLVAIENRLGLKYLQGACEDHYGVPNIGLDNYPNSSGIRTYSKLEWQHQISRAGFAESCFIYPFPDYKVPTLLVSDSALGDSETLSTAISKVHSRDYVGDFDLADDEARLWKGLLEAGTLGEHANSFLLLMSDARAPLDQLSDFSVIEYAMPQFDYLKSGSRGAGDCEAEKNEDSQTARRIEMRSQIDKLSRHSANLQQTIDVMANSRGWRWMNRLRRMFGRPSIK